VAPANTVALKVGTHNKDYDEYAKGKRYKTGYPSKWL